MRDLIGALQTINVLQATCQHVPVQRIFFLQKNLPKCEHGSVETLIKQFLCQGSSRKEYFYHLHEQYVSNRTVDLIFSARPQNASDYKHSQAKGQMKKNSIVSSY